MITFYSLTDSDAVRAVLGIAEEEFEDLPMRASGVEGELVLDIEEWLPGEYSVATIVSEGLAAEYGTTESSLYLRMSAYSKAFCAHFLLISVDNWRKTRLTDGNVDERRSGDIDDEKLKADLEALMAKHQQGVLDLLEEESTPVSSFQLVGKSEPDYDPVTG